MAAENDVAVQSEAALLGALCLAPSKLDEYHDQLRLQDFTKALHRQVWQALLALHTKGAAIDVVALQGELLRLHGNVQDWAQVVLALEGDAAAPAHAGYHARRVVDAAMLRGMVDACRSAVQEAKDVQVGAPGQLDAYVEQVEANVFAAGARCISGATVQATTTVLAQVMGTLDNQVHEGLSLGLPDLDDCLLGLRGGELLIMAARPGVGKTGLALQVALNVAMGGQVPFVVSLEMTSAECVERMLCNVGQVDSYAMRKRRLGLEERERIDQAAATLGQLRMGLCDDGATTVPRLRSLARRWAAQAGGLDLIVVDYLQLMTDPTVKGDRVQEVGNISRNLKALARELRVPIIALSQLSRSGAEGKPQLHHLRDSGALEQDADQVLLLWLDNSEAANVLKVDIAKNRHGRTGVFELAHQPSHYRFACAWPKTEAIYT